MSWKRFMKSSVGHVWHFQLSSGCVNTFSLRYIFEIFAEVWSKVFEEVWLKRVERGILQKSISPADGDLIGGNWRVFSKIDNMNSLKLSGLSFDSLIFLLEQIPSAKFCSKYKFKFFNLKVQPLQINESGCARCEVSC